MKRNYLNTLIASAVLLSQNTHAQQKDYTGQQGQMYVSWGYNKEWYTPSDIHIRQETAGNDYTFKQVKAKDFPGWIGDKDNLFQQPITIPQYSARVGYWFKNDWAIEVNFDHTKFVVEQGQTLHAQGKMNFLTVDTSFLNNGNLVWKLNNGANFVLFNLVKRVQVPRLNYKFFNASLLLKAGVGFVYPHVENTILGKQNTPQFQFGGWDAGAEAALRLTFFKYIYLEYCNKFVYARYSGLRIYEGKARQAFGCYEMIGNIGVNFPICKPKMKKIITEQSAPTPDEKITE